MTVPCVAGPIPCYDEEAAIAAVARDCHAALSEATVYVSCRALSCRFVKSFPALPCGFDTVTHGRREMKPTCGLGSPASNTGAQRGSAPVAPATMVEDWS